MRHVLIESNDGGQRLDRFIKKYLPKMPKSQVQKNIREKRIKVNKKRALGNQILKPGDEVNIYLYEETLIAYEEHPNTFFDNKEVSLNIVYEDDQILVVNKPQGQLAHPNGQRGSQLSLSEELIHYLINSKEYSPEEEKSFVPAFANRLDRNTSGLMIAGKTSEALRDLNQLFQEQKVDRYYTCLCHGLPKEGLVRQNLTKDQNKNKMFLDEGGKEALTTIKVIRTNNKFSELEVQLLTGRTHQIRLALSSLQCPIVGDIKYGSTIQLKDGQMLHAKKIIFHSKGLSLDYLNNREFEAPLPGKFIKLIEEFI